MAVFSVFVMPDKMEKGKRKKRRAAREAALKAEIPLPFLEGKGPAKADSKPRKPNMAK
ncbi:hypothetical protein [Herbaspirillum aquaticum]|uniref:Uncharacterized protein n=1 Tax=Herbaspirillum huttiense subsp. nephrolepidis TaxID=3075126 RepID=A0AAE4GAT7_9BURK|nr:hypothetical protein [Herbaspirillum aquaticum]